MRRMGAVIALTCALVLAGCAGLPTAGFVNPGLPAAEDTTPPEFSFLPERPQPGASPQEIVAGFIRAAAVPADGWSGARLYLSPEFRDAWRPDVGVTIDVVTDRVYSEPAEGDVGLRTTPRANVDEIGAYDGAPGGTGATTLQFHLERQQDGEWRIRSAPDGVLLDADLFSRVYHPYDLMYFDPGWEYLVPDVRWFPTTNAPTRIVTALAGSAAPWLAASVRTAFPDGVAVRPSVPVVGGVAQVEMGDAVLGLDQAAIDRMKAQLDASLASAGVTDAVITVAGAQISATAARTRSTEVDSRALVLTANGFGHLSGQVVEPIPGLSTAISSAAPTAVQLAPNLDAAALRAADGSVVRARANGTVQVLDTRPGLVAPTIDPSGAVWSVPSDDPTAVVVFGSDGPPVALRAWPGASHVDAMQMSRDGTRLLAAVVAGGRSQLWVAGVVRDANRLPMNVGPAVALADLPGRAVDLAWFGDTEAGAAVIAGDRVDTVFQTIGGQSRSAQAPAGTFALAASSPSTIRVLAPGGILSIRRGANWQEVTTGVLALGSAQGSPPR